jgi:hypothetical protein
MKGLYSKRGDCGCHSDRNAISKRVDIRILREVDMKRVMLAATAALSLFAALGIGLAAPANADTFSWSYSGNAFSGSGTDTGSGTLITGGLASTCGSPPVGSCSYVNLPYTTTSGNTITSITGTWDGFTITGLVTPELFDHNNNVLYLSPNGTLLDASSNGDPGGLAFFVSDYIGNNVPTPTTVVVELFFDTTFAAYAALTGNTGFGCCSLGTDGDFTVSSLSAVPLPATFPLFATGLGALGLLSWRSKKKAQAAG